MEEKTNKKEKKNSKKTNENLESPDLISAIEACPVGAITIEEEEEKKN